MFEDSVSELSSSSSLWASMNSWFTPAVFFVLLNIMIGTIVFTSSFTNKKIQNPKNQNETLHQPNIARSSSVLQRLKSSNLYSYCYNRSQEDPHVSSIYKQTPDSHTHFSLETESAHYFFQENNVVHDPQISSIYEHTPGSDKHFSHDHEHFQNLETEAHYFFQENSVQDPQISSIDKPTPESHYFFQENGVEDTQISSIDKQTPDSNTLLYLEKETHYFFQENSVKAPQISSIDKKTPDSNTLFNQENLQISQSHPSNSISRQTHEQHPQNLQTRLVSSRKDPNFDDFDPAHVAKIDENEEERSMDEVYSRLAGVHFGRTKSDTEPSAGEIPAKLPARMRKSASLKSPFGHFEEEEEAVEARRPATAREKTTAADCDDEVDAKADDFINKFKHQLKLQRLDSILRYKDMIGKGSGGG